VFIIIEGIDRSGKSTVSDYYKKQGYEYIHFSAPDKKYSSPGYAGPSYLDEIIEILMNCDGKNVVFDRSWFGELLWSQVYGRQPQLSEDDIDVIREYEEHNQAQRILMVDLDVEAHWQRCVANKEPMNRRQFEDARRLYSKMAHTYQFSILSLPEFIKQNPSTIAESMPIIKTDTLAPSVEVPQTSSRNMSPEQATLEKANAINTILKSKRLFKQQGWPYDDLENQVRIFLNDRLGDLLGRSKDNGILSKEDILIVKEFVKRLRDKGVKVNEQKS